MENNGTIITQIGTKQQLFRDRNSYPHELCDYIENIITCNSSELSSEGGTGRIRFNTLDNKLVVQLSINEGNSFISDNSKAIVLIRMLKGKIKSPVYYGIDCSIDFKSNCNIYSLDTVDSCVESFKNFYSSWSLTRGSIGAVVLIIDDYRVFEKVISDDFFKYSYILYSE